MDCPLAKGLTMALQKVRVSFDFLYDDVESDHPRYWDFYEALLLSGTEVITNIQTKDMKVTKNDIQIFDEDNKEL